MEALLLLFLFLFAAALVLLTKFTDNNELFMILAGILFILLSLPLNVEGLTFDTPTSKSYNQSFIYDPATLTPTNSTISVTYSNLTKKDIYTDGLSGLFFMLGLYTTWRGGFMVLEKREKIKEVEE